jgi:hypothetical protein
MCTDKLLQVAIAIKAKSARRTTQNCAGSLTWCRSATKSGCATHQSPKETLCLWGLAADLVLVLLMHASLAVVKETYIAGGLRSLMNADLPLQVGPNTRADRESLRFSADQEKAWFELDREVVLDQIDSLHRALDQNSGELSMIATEGVFERTVSDKLSRAARTLRSLSQQLAGLRAAVVKTNGYPRRNRSVKI